MFRKLENEYAEFIDLTYQNKKKINASVDIKINA